MRQRIQALEQDAGNLDGAPAFLILDAPRTGEISPSYILHNQQGRPTFSGEVDTSIYIYLLK